MKNKLLTLLFLLLSPSCLFAEGHDGNTYDTPERLFYISRSANKNLICYDVNAEKGKLNLDNPLKVYWVNREERPGETNGLSFIQRKLAYGYKVVSTQENMGVFTLTAYPKRQLTVAPYRSGYACFVKINHQNALLKSLYVKASPHNPLKVEYVELRGVSLATHRPVTERVNNK